MPSKAAAPPMSSWENLALCSSLPYTSWWASRLSSEKSGLLAGRVIWICSGQGTLTKPTHIVRLEVLLGLLGGMGVLRRWLFVGSWMDGREKVRIEDKDRLYTLSIFL